MKYKHMRGETGAKESNSKPLGDDLVSGVLDGLNVDLGAIELGDELAIEKQNC